MTSKLMKDKMEFDNITRHRIGKLPIKILTPESLNLRQPLKPKNKKLSYCNTETNLQ